MTPRRCAAALLAVLPLAACGQTAAPVVQPRFEAIAADETIHVTGTEPFWAATVAGAAMVYSTPEDQAGIRIAVQRFAGNAGLSFAGQGGGGGPAYDLTITKGECSDGMSDRRYPYTATLRIGDEVRTGCAFTDRQPARGGEG